jgi:hypothetical protein
MKTAVYCRKIRFHWVVLSVPIELLVRHSFELCSIIFFGKTVVIAMHRDDGEQDIVVGDNNQDNKNVLEKITKKKEGKKPKTLC